MAGERGVYIHPECLAAIMLEESDPTVGDDPRVPVLCERCAAHRDRARDRLIVLYNEVLQTDESYLGRRALR